MNTATKLASYTDNKQADDVSRDDKPYEEKTTGREERVVGSGWYLVTKGHLSDTGAMWVSGETPLRQKHAWVESSIKEPSSAEPSEWGERWEKRTEK